VGFGAVHGGGEGPSSPSGVRSSGFEADLKLLILGSFFGGNEVDEAARGCDIQLVQPRAAGAGPPPLRNFISGWSLKATTSRARFSHWVFSSVIYSHTGVCLGIIKQFSVLE
jgi:hypothetical protein